MGSTLTPTTLTPTSFLGTCVSDCIQELKGTLQCDITEYYKNIMVYYGMAYYGVKNNQQGSGQQ